MLVEKRSAKGDGPNEKHGSWSFGDDFLRARGVFERARCIAGPISVWGRPDDRPVDIHVVA